MKNITTIIIAAAVGAICAYTVASVQHAPTATKGRPTFEYNSISAGMGPYANDALNKLGAEGWECCALFNGAYVFKRQK